MPAKPKISWGEFCLYPTLYLAQEERRTLLARGYVPWERVAASLEAALADDTSQTAFPEGAACGLDGHCDIPTDS